MARKRVSHKIVTEAVPICMDTIAELDNGNCRRLVDKAIKRILEDISDRGDEDGKPRLMELSVEFIKVDGRIIMTPTVAAKVPKYVAHSTQAVERIDENGECLVLFQPFNAANAEQPVFNEVDTDSQTPPKG